MRIALINSSIKRGLAYGLNDGMPTGLMDYLGGYQPLGICYMAAVLRKEGFKDFFLVDAQAQDLGISKITDRLRLFSPDIIGVSCMSFSFLYALNLSNAIKKEFFNIPIVIGGSHVDLYPEQVLSHTCFDIGVLGEGEQAFLDIVRLLEQDKGNFNKNLDRIEGIAFRKDKKILFRPRQLIKELDALPFPAIDLLNMDDYKQNYLPNPFVSILSSRGCPYGCSYCCKRSWDKYIRSNSPEYVADEVEYFYNKYKARSFQFFDDTFTLQKSRVVEICSLLIKRKINIKFLILTRVDKVDKDILEILKAAGCDCISFGVESGDQAILDHMKKGYNIDQIKNAFFLCKKAGINIVAYFLIGHPAETNESIKNTINLINETKPDWFKANILTLYPGAPIYNELIEKGMITDFWKEMTISGKPFLNPDINRNFTKKELENFMMTINLMPYFRKKSNLLNFFKLKNPSNVIWSLRWLKTCLLNKIKLWNS